MARPKKDKANGAAKKAKPAEDKPNELTDEQRQALFFSHKKRYEALLAAKKKADAEFKNGCKLAKAELGDTAVDDIKDAILLETEEGEAQIKAEIERKLRVARWMAVPMGAQADMFAQPDRTPAVDRAYAEGKKAGLAGETLKSPYAPELPQNDSFITGWHDGQAALFSIQRKTDGALFEQSDQEDAKGDERRRELSAEPPAFEDDDIGDQPTAH